MKANRATYYFLLAATLGSLIVNTIDGQARGADLFLPRYYVQQVGYDAAPATGDVAFEHSFSRPFPDPLPFNSPSSDFNANALPMSDGNGYPVGQGENAAVGGPEKNNASPAMRDRIYETLPDGIVPVWGPRTPEEYRHSGLGDPLEGTSWLTRSHSAGSFFGPIFGATSANDRLDPGIGGMFGLRFGWDYDHRWGLEKRFGFAQMSVFDLEKHLRQQINLELGDVDLMFYPWGDSRWRPYLMTGVGASHYNFQEDSGHRASRILIGLPFGMGVKYLYSEGLLWRLDVYDNLMLGGGGVETMNNLSVALAVEFRFDNLGYNHRKQ